MSYASVEVLSCCLLLLASGPVGFRSGASYRRSCLSSGAMLTVQGRVSCHYVLESSASLVASLWVFCYPSGEVPRELKLVTGYVQEGEQGPVQMEQVLRIRMQLTTPIFSK